MLNTTSLSLLFSFLVCTLFGQVEEDPLLFFKQLPARTTQSIATAGALSSLGKDLNCFHSNPAGLALYDGWDLELRTGFWASKKNFSPVIGAGVAITTNSSKNWVLGLGLNMHSSTAETRSYSVSEVSVGSQLEEFVEQANRDASLDPLRAALAEEAALIQQTAHEYISGISNAEPIYRQKEQRIKQVLGGFDSYLGAAIKYKNKLSIGLSLEGVVRELKQTKHYQEKELSDTSWLRKLAFTEFHNRLGSGINFKLGGIYQISPQFSFGFRLGSPGFMKLEDSIYTEIAGQFRGTDSLYTSSEASNFVQYKARFRSPWSFAIHAAYTFGQEYSAIRGKLGIDGEYIHYPDSRFFIDQENAQAFYGGSDFVARLNQSIGQSYRGLFKLSIGGELSVNRLHFRLGYRIAQAPYLKLQSFSHYISTGIGIVLNKDINSLNLSFAYTSREFYHSLESSQKERNLVVLVSWRSSF